jgi:hypothetical protein
MGNSPVFRQSPFKLGQRPALTQAQPGPQLGVGPEFGGAQVRHITTGCRVDNKTFPQGTATVVNLVAQLTDALASKESRLTIVRYWCLGLRSFCLALAGKGR